MSCSLPLWSSFWKFFESVKWVGEVFAGDLLLRFLCFFESVEWVDKVTKGELLPALLCLLP